MNTEPLTDRDSLLAGTVAGVGAWVVGYVVVYLIAGTRIEESVLNRFVEAFGGESATYELVGWVFFDAHFVETVVDVQIAFLDSQSTVRLVGGEDGFTAALYLVPPVLLLLAGVVVGRLSGTTEPADGAVAGTFVVPPYALFCLLGAVVFQVSVGGSSGGPGLLEAAFVAGILYPAVFGGVGGAIGAATADEGADRLR
ncbi:MAG: hypothetical protein PPP58_09825 [Natronomonas sp.]